MSREHLEREIDMGDAPAELREALKAAREAGPSPERIARAREATLQRFAHELAAGAAAGAGAALGVGSPSSLATGAGGSMAAQAVSGWAATWTAKVVLIGGAVVAAAGGWVWAAHEPTQAPRETAPRVEVRVPALPEPALPEASPEPTQPPPAAPDPEALAPARAESLEDTPGANEPAPERARPRASRRHRSAPAPTPVSQGTLGEEIALLTRARRALQDRPEQTLRLTAEHAHDFPSGRFVQEREVLAVHALLRRGARVQALERGRRFLETYPDSTHARRVAALLEAAEP